MQLVRATTKQQLHNIHALYQRAFPISERKPFSMILRKQKEGSMEILSIEHDSGEFLGLAVLIHYHDLHLLDYFAVSPDCRGQGVGSKALGLLQARYADGRLLLEIERTDVECKNLDERLRRKQFYLKNGMQQADFLVDLFGVDMEILTHNCTVSYCEYHEVFEQVFSKRIAAHVRRIS